MTSVSTERQLLISPEAPCMEFVPPGISQNPQTPNWPLNAVLALCNRIMDRIRMMHKVAAPVVPATE